MNEGNDGRGAGAPSPDGLNAPRGRKISRRGLLELTAGLAALAATPTLAQPFVLRVAPRATHVVVSKPLRVMELRNGREILKRYRIGLGFSPEGHKLRSGDGRTPEGQYWIDRRNPRSDFHLSIGITYPNAADIARARALGVDPGGDIFVHGEPVRSSRRNGRDWTAGCIAVTNDEIEEIWALTPTGVPITILA